MGAAAALGESEPPDNAGSRRGSFDSPFPLGPICPALRSLPHPFRVQESKSAPSAQAPARHCWINRSMRALSRRAPQDREGSAGSGRGAGPAGNPAAAGEWRSERHPVRPSFVTLCPPDAALPGERRQYFSAVATLSERRGMLGCAGAAAAGLPCAGVWTYARPRAEAQRTAGEVNGKKLLIMRKGRRDERLPRDFIRTPRSTSSGRTECFLPVVKRFCRPQARADQMY